MKYKLNYEFQFDFQFWAWELVFWMRVHVLIQHFFPSYSQGQVRRGPGKNIICKFFSFLDAGTPCSRVRSAVHCKGLYGDFNDRYFKLTCERGVPVLLPQGRYQYRRKILRQRCRKGQKPQRNRTNCLLRFDRPVLCCYCCSIVSWIIYSTSC